MPRGSYIVAIIHPNTQDSCSNIPKPLSLFRLTVADPKTPKPLKAMASFAARSMLRSAAARTTTLGSRVASAARPKPAAAPFGIPKQNKNPISHAALFRSPVELSCCVESLLPYHTATASALLTSMLSVSQRSYGWTPQGKDKTR